MTSAPHLRLLETPTLRTPMLAMRQVERVYAGPPTVTALPPMDLTVYRGDYLAVVGPSGSGKSTLLNLIGLLDRPGRGTYEFFGLDTATMSDSERTGVRARQIGFVFQELHLLPLHTVLENVMLAQLYGDVPHATRREQAAEVLEKVGLGRRVYAVANILTGPERRRLAIARALINRPSLLLCDEPTGNLDSVAASAILDLLDALHGTSITLMVVTHDQAVAARAHRTIAIQGSSAPGRSPGGLEAVKPA